MHYPCFLLEWQAILQNTKEKLFGNGEKRLYSFPTSKVAKSSYAQEKGNQENKQTQTQR